MPSLAAQAAGPRRCWPGSACCASVALALTFAALGVRMVAGGSATYVRAAFGRRAGAVDRLVVPGRRDQRRPGRLAHRRQLRRRPAGRRPRGRRDRRGDVIGRRRRRQRRGLHTTARIQLGLAGCSPSSCSSPSTSALPAGASGPLDAVRAARMGRDRDRGEPPDALVRRLGGRLASGRRLRDPQRQLPGAMFAALRLVGVLYLGLAVATSACSARASPRSVPLAELMAGRPRRRRARRDRRAAVLLAIGTMNAYVAGAMQPRASSPARDRRPRGWGARRSRSSRSGGRAQRCSASSARGGSGERT